MTERLKSSTSIWIKKKGYYMKKVLILISVFIAIMLASCNSSTVKVYTREEMQTAIAEAEQRGFEEAYAEAEYGVRATLEQEYREELHSAEAEIEYLKRISDDAFDAGYQRGYSDGYDDCMEEYGLQPKNEYTPSKKKE